jgi:hypothetical protein
MKVLVEKVDREAALAEADDLVVAMLAQQDCDQGP